MINLLALSQSDCRNFYSHMIMLVTELETETLNIHCINTHARTQTQRRRRTRSFNDLLTAPGVFDISIRPL